MASVAASAGLLVTGATVGLALPRAGTCAAQVASGHERALTLDLLDEPPARMLEEGSVVDMFVTVSAGLYKWLCIVSQAAADNHVTLQLLNGPVFVPARSDPRIVVNLPAQVCADGPDRQGRPRPAVVTDLSRGGMKLEGAPDLHVGDLIEVTLELAPSLGAPAAPVSIMGRVVTACASTVGAPPGGQHVHISFIGGQQKALDAVGLFVAQRLERIGIA
jgi:hypothetical protein